jgi:UDP-N-acetylmuramyl pentapeptide phosphotransferase/UDP-N-acetylglucosamine-1-phosphate transferase
MVPLFLLLIFITCAAMSLLLCGIARILFPKFRSGEFKPGPHRSDLPAGGREIKTIELPLVGGPAFILAIILTGIGACILFSFTRDQWTLLIIGLVATCGYMVVGFIDDWHKV